MKVYSCVSAKSLVALALTCVFMIHFQSTCHVWCEVRVQLHSSAGDYPVAPAQLLERLLPSHSAVMARLLKINWLSIYRFISGFFTFSYEFEDQLVSLCNQTAAGIAVTLWRIFGLFPLWDHYENPAMNICAHSLCGDVFISLKCALEVQLQSHTLCSQSWGTESIFQSGCSLLRFISLMSWQWCFVMFTTLPSCYHGDSVLSSPTASFLEVKVLSSLFWGCVSVTRNTSRRVCFENTSMSSVSVTCLHLGCGRGVSSTWTSCGRACSVTAFSWEMS